MSKYSYLLQSIKKQLLGHSKTCPACGSQVSTIISRKYWVTSLNRCSNCQLQFRVPTTSEEENQRFYQRAYKQGFTTELPSEQELESYISRKFAGTDKNYAQYIALLSLLGVKEHASILDFGCSWGYGSWQFIEHGYQVKALEISDPRRNFAKTNLGIDAVKELSEINEQFDVFFSAHVLEHVPNPIAIINASKRLLKPGGVFIAITPNGSETYKKKNFESWNQLWGYVHPNFLDDRFYKSLAPEFKFGSLSPTGFTESLEHYELVAFYRKL